MLARALNSASQPPSAPPTVSVSPPVSSLAPANASSTPSLAAAPQAPPAAPIQPSSAAQIIIGWAPQLRQMRELGITDDIVAIQALEATNGDVQAAINIIFSDFN